MSSSRVFLLAGVILREEVLLFECHVMRCVCPSMGMDVPPGLHTGQHFLCGLPQTLSLFTRIGNAGLRGQAYKWRVFVGLRTTFQGDHWSTLRDRQKTQILDALRQTRGNKRATAALLGISLRGLHYRLKRLGTGTRGADRVAEAGAGR